MSKRRLTEQQLRRQTSNQQKRREFADNQGESGLVISHHGKHFVIENQAGKLFHCKTRQNLGTIVTGDSVVWEPIGEDTGVVTACLPRANLIERSVNNKLKALAANVDQLIIMCALKPMPQQTTLDRYLVLAHELQLEPIILCNKWDLRTSKHDWIHERLQAYEAIGYNTLTLCADQAADFSELFALLNKKTNILVGQSGVGKSTLINQLIPHAQAQTGQIAEQKGLGKHTTTVTRLYHLDCGGHLIDSPGIREFKLTHIDSDKLFSAFLEFQPYLGQCKFRNCLHKNEPECALRLAVDCGKIAQFRLDNYNILMDESAESNAYN